jgi:hypothetical protein
MLTKRGVVSSYTKLIIIIIIIIIITIMWHVDKLLGNDCDVVTIERPLIDSDQQTEHTNGVFCKVRPELL